MSAVGKCRFLSISGREQLPPSPPVSYADGENSDTVLTCGAMLVCYRVTIVDEPMVDSS